MKYKLALISILFNGLLLMQSAMAATPFSPAPAPDEIRTDSQGITLVTGSCVTRVEVWTPRIIRVTHRPAGSSPHSAGLSVIVKPVQTEWKLLYRPGYAVLVTSVVQASVDKATGAVEIRDSGGASVLAETPGGTSFRTANVGGAATLAVRQQFNLDPSEAIYGLGQHQQGVMNYVGTSVRLQQENREVGVPVLLSSKGYAVLWDNPAVTDVDAGKSDKASLTWTSEAGGGVDYYLIEGPEPDQAIAGYRWLTGSAPMFGKWAWGFWQCRERYKTQDEVLGVAAEYRRRAIPIDGIIQDWQYWPPLNQATAEGGWGSHQFDPARYPDPAGMLESLHRQNVHVIISVWAKFDVTNAGVSIPNLQRLEAVDGAFSPAIPYAFPKGHGKWYDPFDDKAREVYWKEVSSHLFAFGLDGWWLDASEPELSGKWGEFRNFSTASGPGALVYNAYPLEHTKAVYEGQRSETSAKRVFILTRSAYAGQQRNAAVTWSGDIAGTWATFQKQIPAGLNFTASGIPYWNTDIGGFFGGDPADPKYTELFTRWFQFGAFCPMFRVHGTGKSKEVWQFDQATQGVLIDFINLRYRLLPYIYSVSWMVTNDGYTMMRPLVMDFRADSRIRNIADQYLFGPSLMVCPVVQPGATTRSVYLPAGTSWIDFWTGKTCEGGQQIDAPAPIQTMPIFVRAGAILPCGPAVQYAAEKPAGPIELRVYRGADGNFTLYEDEGDNYNYEKGAYATIPIHWDEKKQTLVIGERSGGFPGMPRERIFDVVWVSPGHGAGLGFTKEIDAELKYRGDQVTISAPRRTVETL